MGILSDMNSLMTRLKKLRGSRSQTQVEIQTGVGQRTISRWESSPPEYLESLVSLARYYQVSTDYLLGLTDDPRPTSTTAYHHNITDEQAAILELFERLDEDERRYVLGLLDFIKSRNTPRIIGEE